MSKEMMMENPQDTAPAMPRINEPAPAFEARTTHGVKKLEDYRGKWLVLFSTLSGKSFHWFAKSGLNVP